MICSDAASVTTLTLSQRQRWNGSVTLDRLPVWALVGGLPGSPTSTNSLYGP